MNRAWYTEYIRRQEQVNACAREIFQPRLREVEKIVLMTPSDQQQYLRKHPCADCGAEPCCDTPCPVYLQWYNARLWKLRRRLFRGS